MGKRKSVVIGFTEHGEPIIQLPSIVETSRGRPARPTKYKHEFKLPIDPAIAPTADGAIIDGVFVHKKDIPEAVRNLLKDET